MKVVPDKFAIEGRDVGGIVLLNGTTWTVGLKQKLVDRTGMIMMDVMLLT